MRVAWEKRDEYWYARIGPCWLMLYPMDWYHARAREYRDAVIEGRAWVFTIRHYPDRTDLDSRVTLSEGDFEVPHRVHAGGEREAQERVIAIAREFELCKRTRRVREAVDPESVTWLEELLLTILRESYARWRDSVARYGRGIYPEPRWTTARLAMEAAQHGGRPDDPDVSDRRFYQLVYAALERLRRRGLLERSMGLDDRGREAPLWEPV